MPKKKMDADERRHWHALLDVILNHWDELAVRAITADLEAIGEYARMLAECARKRELRERIRAGKAEGRVCAERDPCSTGYQA